MRIIRNKHYENEDKKVFKPNNNNNKINKYNNYLPLM